ncbi:MAG: hypothetical protein LBR50_00635 [Tannerella sp.]|jgi:hypothetical protein|nr:hypothetical protein [Tannerella sp.]
MVEKKLMTEEEKDRVYSEALRLSKAGKKAEARALENTIPFQPWAAAFIKKYLGLEELLSIDGNFAEVEKVYGKEWLVK